MDEAKANNRLIIATKGEVAAKNRRIKKSKSLAKRTTRASDFLKILVELEFI